MLVRKKLSILEVPTLYFTCSENWKSIFPDHFKNIQNHTIECLTIDDLAKKYSIPEREHFDLIKIDVEGHDINVIKSFCDSNITCTSIIFEIPYNLKEIKISLDLLKQKGFSEFFVFGRTGIPTTYIGEFISVDHINNLYSSGRIQVGNIVGFVTS
jgi:hypothetical protein